VSGPSVAAAVLRKDLRLDLRSRDRLGHMAVFALLVVALVSIFAPTAKAERMAWTPALLWIVLLFTAVLGLGRSFQSETEEGAVAFLAQAPVDRGWVFLGKAGAALVALLGVELWTAVLFTVFLDVDWTPGLLPCALAGLLGAVGLSAIGTLFSALAMGARFREFLFPALFFPVVLPILVWASKITALGLGGGETPAQLWLVFVLYDWTFALIGYFGFDYVLED
jgi:heme exporter protein B